MTEIKDPHSVDSEDKEEIFSDDLNTDWDPNIDYNYYDRMGYVLEDVIKLGGYFELLEFLPEVLESGEKTAKKLMETGISLALLSSQKVIGSLKLTNLSEMELGIKKAELLLADAKTSYFYKNYQNSYSALNEVRALTTRLKEDQKKSIMDLLKCLESEIQNAKCFGVNIKLANIRLKEAKKWLDSDLQVQATEAVFSGMEHIESAKDDRIKVIFETITFVEKLVDAAFEIGTDVTIARKELEKAKVFFGEGQYQLCMHATIKAEEVSVDLIHTQAEKVRNLQHSLVTRFQEVSTTDEDQKNSKSEKGNSKDSEDSENKSVNQNLCPYCQNQAEYYDRYRRWYCAYCMKYL
jgi:regulator of RNase E activity RraB